MTVRTRFAPSPTGYLHIGGVRTALFNWLFARHHGGQYILRIDDTDQQRNIEQALQPILEGFRWLGLDWDEGPDIGGPHAPYFQSARHTRHQEAVDQLVARGFAYLDYATSDEIQAERLIAQNEKRKFVYSRRWMAETDEQVKQFLAEGRKSIVRLKMPRQGNCEFVDLVRGSVEFEWSLEQDHVVQRADGSCLYHLASTVDDYDFRITHVIRAVEHLSNTPRQIFIAQALDYPLPNYVHLPYVAEPGSAAKLSKRKFSKYLHHQDFKEIYNHGASVLSAIGEVLSSNTFSPVTIDFYRKVGYQPDAILNYLLLLGWSFDDKTETFNRSEMIKHFNLENINKSAASFDPKKLIAFQDRYMQKISLSNKVKTTLPFLERAGIFQNKPNLAENERLLLVLDAAGDRIKVSGDILNYVEFFQGDEVFLYDDKAFDKRLRVAGAAEKLGRFRVQLEEADPFDATTLEEMMHKFIETESITIAQIIHAVRISVTGKAVGFGLFDSLAILGRKACLLRIDRALARLAS
jgi:glutamyl-tRNA synthetase